METSTRLRIPYLEDRILSLYLPPPELWPGIEQVCRRLKVPSDLMLAVIMVESELRPQHAPGALAPLPRRVARRLYADDAPWELALELAATYLAVQLERFGRVSLALLAYHTVADWVAEQGDAMLDIPIYGAYVRSVLTTLRWLSHVRPWQAWPVEVAS
jgi:hypothetical protein